MMKNINTYLQSIAINNLVVGGMSFREAYQKIEARFKKGRINPI